MTVNARGRRSPQRKDIVADDGMEFDSARLCDNEMPLLLPRGSQCHNHEVNMSSQTKPTMSAQSIDKVGGEFSSNPTVGNESSVHSLAVGLQQLDLQTQGGSYPFVTSGKNCTNEVSVHIDMNEDKEPKDPDTCFNELETSYAVTTSNIRPTEFDINPETIYSANEDGDTLLHEAIVHGIIDLMFRILVMTPSVHLLNIENNLQQTALHLAVLTRQPKIVRLLVSRGANLEARDIQGNTPLHLACNQGDLESVISLSKPVCYSETVPCLYRVPFQMTPQDSCILNYKGQTCLHIAASNGHLAIIKYLASGEVRANVNVQDACSGKTILHQAIEQRDSKLLKYLLQSRLEIRLDVNVRTYSGLTPLQLSRIFGQRDVNLILKFCGAEDGSFIPDDEIMDSDDDVGNI